MSNRNKLIAAGISAAIAATLAGNAMAQAAGAKPAGAPGQKPQAATPEMIFNAWDKDKNKSLSLDEFKAGWQEIEMRQIVAKLHQQFVQMDANKSGALEQNEFANLEIIKKAGAKAPMHTATTLDTRVVFIGQGV